MPQIKNILYFIKNFFLKKGGHTFMFRFLGMVLNYVITLLITSIYGSSNYGLYAISLTILQLMVMFFSFGIPSAFVSFSGAFESENQNKGLLLKSYLLVTILSVIPLILFFFNVDLITNFYGKPDLKSFLQMVALSILFMVFHEINCNYFLSLKKFYWFGLTYFVFPNVLFLIFILFSKLFQLPNYCILLSYTLSVFITVVVTLFIIFRKLEFMKVTIKSKEILKRSLPMMASGFFLILLNWTDVLMLGKFESERNIGIYNAAFKIGYLTLFFVMAMGSLIIADVARFFNNNQNLELHLTVKKATQLTAILTIPLATIIIVFSEQLLFLFGSEFIEGRTALILITLGALFNALTGNVDQFLNTTGNQISVRNVMFVGFLINICLNFILIPIYGINGAAFSSLVVNVIVNTIFIIIIKKKFGFYTFV